MVVSMCERGRDLSFFGGVYGVRTGQNVPYMLPSSIRVMKNSIIRPVHAPLEHIARAISCCTYAVVERSARAISYCTCCCSGTCCTDNIILHIMPFRNTLHGQYHIAHTVVQYTGIKLRNVPYMLLPNILNRAIRSVQAGIQYIEPGNAFRGTCSSPTH